MFKNINDIMDRISEISPDLAVVVEEIFGRLKELSDDNSEHNSRDLEKILDRISDRIGNINMIPGMPGSCHKLCISKAFGKWNSRKNGFKGIVEKTIAYWMSCSEVNRDTIILTNAPCLDTPSAGEFIR